MTETIRVISQFYSSSLVLYHLVNSRILQSERGLDAVFKQIAISRNALRVGWALTVPFQYNSSSSCQQVSYFSSVVDIRQKAKHITLGESNNNCAKAEKQVT